MKDNGGGVHESNYTSITLTQSQRQIRDKIQTSHFPNLYSKGDFYHLKDKT